MRKLDEKTPKISFLGSEISVNTLWKEFYTKGLSTDSNWMLLFIDTDQNKETGWEGYDFVINSKVNNRKTSKLPF